MPSEEPLEDRCGAECRDGGYCTQYPVTGSERCRMHGGTTPTQDENANVGAGAAGPGNGRALSHGVRADPFNLYQHLDDDEREWVDDLVDTYVEDVLEFDEGDPRVERVRRACIHIYQSWSGEAHILADGLSEETVVGVDDDGRPVVDKDGHHLHRYTFKRDKEARQILKDLGAFDDPQSQTADAVEGVISVLSAEANTNE